MTHPLENDFMLDAVKYVYREGTLGEYITNALDGKVRNSSLVAHEIEKNIKQSTFNKDATLEERAMERELAYKFTEYIAETYLTEEEGKEFMSEIT